MLKFNFFAKFSIYIFSTFILFTVIGTLSHELGHAAVAEFLGYNSDIGYGSMHYHYEGYYEDKDVKELFSFAKDYSYKNYHNWPDSIKAKVLAKQKIIQDKFPYNKSHDLWITIGGPFQTISTSLLGLLILFLRRENRKFYFNIL